METTIVSLVCIALMVFGGMTMSQGFLTAVDSTAVSLEEVGEKGEEIMRTELSPLAITMSGEGRTLEVTLENNGQTKLADFSKWDVIAQYYGEDDADHVTWLPYTEGTPGYNGWTVEGIYLDTGEGTSEVFELGILNPGEEIVIEAQLNPKLKQGHTGLVVISTPSGIPASTTFSR